jgi:hypothetical protein
MCRPPLALRRHVITWIILFALSAATIDSFPDQPPVASRK